MPFITLVHTSPDKNLNITADAISEFNQTIFLTGPGSVRPSDAIAMTVEEALEASYRPHGTKDCFVHVFCCAWDDFSYIEADSLSLDDIAEKEIRKLVDAEFKQKFGRKLTKDECEQILNEEESFKFWDEDGTCWTLYDIVEDALGWAMQRIQAERANRAGYLFAVSHDEQGEVFMIDWSGREEEIRAMFTCVGSVEDLNEMDEDEIVFERSE